MNCPVCDRDLVATLSICPSCGAMMNDSVREEMAVKVMPSGDLDRRISMPSEPLAPPPVFVKKNPFAVPPPAIRESTTAELAVSKTSPTLVDFQPASNVVPEWRLQMQNAVRARRGSGEAVAAQTTPTLLRTNGSAAFKAQPIAQEIPENADPRLGSALDRIAKSRSSFAPEPPIKRSFPPREPVVEKSYPFGVVEPVASLPISNTPERKATVNQLPRPALVAAVPAAVPAPISLKLDTNKLPKLVEITDENPEEAPETRIGTPRSSRFEFANIKRIFIPAETIEPEIEVEEEYDEIEDLAPIGMRFGSGLFDMIIAVAASMLLLSPFAITSGNWAGLSGLLILTATAAMVSFVYLTLSIGLYGRSIGMRLFSLEIVDAERNVYPTMKQAAANSAIYLISAVFGGAGFLTVFFNDENRAAHDLLSGTIVVREF
ncbi:MAG TPA: RDD family protein [Pyrinomonadaceae bacterium]|nr:RDD family protein [Pyrinomonadaceae bacterium]